MGERCPRSESRLGGQNQDTLRCTLWVHPQNLQVEETTPLSPRRVFRQVLQMLSHDFHTWTRR